MEYTNHIQSEVGTYEVTATFKDSSGYGMVPTTQEKINKNGSNIKTNLELTRPVGGNISGTWEGFTTEGKVLKVLQSESDGINGDKENTCTLVNKEDNYEESQKLKCGDVNFDGKVDADDATMILNIFGEIIPIKNNQIWRADVNADGKVNSTDSNWVYNKPVESLKCSF